MPDIFCTILTSPPLNTKHSPAPPSYHSSSQVHSADAIQTLQEDTEMRQGDPTLDEAGHCQAVSGPPEHFNV